MQDVIMTYMSGTAFCKNPMIMVFINSLLSTGFTGEKVILTHEMDDVDKEKFVKLGFSVRKIDQRLIPSVLHWRWRAFWNYLKNREDQYRFVYFADCKDIVWQVNPSDYLENEASKLPSEFVRLSHEGIAHFESEWNLNDRKKFCAAVPAVLEDLSCFLIINGGIQGGTYSSMKNFAFLMYCASMTASLNYSDQATINQLYYEMAKDRKSPFIIQFFDDTFAACGNTIKELKYNPSLIWENQTLYEPNTKLPYCVYHQWDRTPHRSEILNKYLTEVIVKCSS